MITIILPLFDLPCKLPIIEKQLNFTILKNNSKSFPVSAIKINIDHLHFKNNN